MVNSSTVWMEGKYESGNKKIPRRIPSAPAGCTVVCGQYGNHGGMDFKAMPRFQKNIQFTHLEK
ncbi:hypothetical protein [Cupriavidus pauculus]|uniref:hypothetical protein n=1 Tax=Cupriavidus pauculus TaxID=82633 RepID=UPI0011AFC70A|nr:hypothetical protein [Cupriavidus pauculus]